MDKNAATFNQDSQKYWLNRPRYPIALYELLAKMCPVKERAWDCGCGNGQVAADLVQYFQRVDASDINENQIIHSYAHERIRYSVQRSERTDYPDACFDLVCAAQCMHWFDLEEYFQEVHRVLKPAGVFACWGYSFFTIGTAIDEIVEKILLRRIDPYWSAKNRVLHRGYQGVSFPFARQIVPALEMKVRWNREQLLAYLSTWSAVKLYNGQASTAIEDELRTALQDVWDAHECQEVKMDFFLHVLKRL